MANQEFNQPAKTGSRFFYGYIVMVAAFMIRMAMYGPRSSFGVFFKPLVTDFGWSRALISGAYSVSTVMQGVSGIAMGGLNDRLGPRVVLSVCGLLVGLGTLLMSRVSVTWQLYLFYGVIVGIGMGSVFTVTTSTVARWFAKRRSVMTGIVLAGGGIGGIIIPPAINWLISAHGWPNAFIIMGAVVLVVVVLVAQFLKRDPSKMGLLPYGMSRIGKPELPLSVEGLSLNAAIRTGQFWMVFIMVFSFGFCYMANSVHIVPYATDLGISAVTAANILATLSGAFLVGSIVLGGLADRIGNRPTFIMCFILISATLLWLLVATDVWMLYLFAIVLGLGGGGSATLESTLTAELFGVKSHGLILGVIGIGYTSGAAAGPFVAGYIFDISGSYHQAFLITAAVGVVGLIVSLIIRPIKKLKMESGVLY